MKNHFGQNYFGDALLHSTDFHKVNLSLDKDTSVANTVTLTYSNLSPVAHEISSGEAPKGGKGSYIDISFLQLPNHIHIAKWLQQSAYCYLF